MKRATIREVAREAGVALMTVSRVLNGNSSVTAKTERKVRAAMLKVGYQPNEAARMLKGRPSTTIGLIVPYFDEFFGTCFHAVQEVAKSRGYMTYVAASERRESEETKQALDMVGRRVAGLLIASCCETSDLYSRPEFNNVHIVGLDRPIASAGIDSVLVENRGGSEEAIRHLIQHGHKSILSLGFDNAAYTVAERIAGYTNAMRDAGLKVDVSANVTSAEDMDRLIATRWAAKNRPTAIFTLQYLASVHAINAMTRQGIEIPKDIAMIGFDDFALAPSLRSPLTAVAQSADEIGTHATEMLFKKIFAAEDAPRKTSQGSKMICPTQLIIRKSCGCHG